MITRIWNLLVAVLISAQSVLAAEECGGPKTPCTVEKGGYFAARPEGSDLGHAVIYLHGYGGSGAKAIANVSFAEQFTSRGYTLIVPDGQPHTAPGTKGKRDWGVRDDFDWPRDDVAFLRTVISDAKKRFGVRSDELMMLGYSRGGSMAWDVACLAPETARAFAAYGGSFWEPMIGECRAPVHLHHAHGFSDRTVPLEGRPFVFFGFPFEQGDVFKGLNIWTTLNGCGQPATKASTKGTFWTKAWTDCEAGSVTLALGPGGHGRPKEWIGLALDWFETLPDSDS